LADNVGICNRVSKCGYHYTPREFFEYKPEASAKRKRAYDFTCSRRSKEVGNDYLKPEHVLATLQDYEHNPFIRFLLQLFPEDSLVVQYTVSRYLIGTYKTFTVFPKISRDNKICGAKLMKFNPQTGKRLKGSYTISSLPFELARAGKIPNNFQADNRVFFGEHLTRNNSTPVALVEAEKTAILGSIVCPDFAWLATGSKQFLKAEKLQRLGTRKFILYPDADGFQEWNRTASEAREAGLDVSLSTLIETYASQEEKAQQYDLADYIIRRSFILHTP
jgi:hypothetical protein